jgi:hypothetical protein
MRIRPVIIVSAIIAFGAAGVAMSAAEVTAAATHVPSVYAHVTDSAASPAVMYKG